MQIKWSGIGIVDGAGKFGGSIASRNKSGAVVRKYTKPNNPQTNAQLAQRGSFSSIASAFRSLDAEKIEAWNTAAASGEWNSSNKMGESIRPSGSVLYARLNNSLAAVGEPSISTPPLKVSLSNIVVDALNLETPAFELSYTGTLTADETLQLSATAPISAGVSRPGQFKAILTSNGASPVNLTTAYAAVYGSYSVGQRITVRAEIVNTLTGQRAVIGQATSVVTS